MLLTDITKIIRVLLAAFETMASQDDLTQRRIDQIGQVIGAVEDVAETEEKPDATVAEKRVEEAHDIIHRIAAILAMEEGRERVAETGTTRPRPETTRPETLRQGGAGHNDDALREEPWNGKLDGETIELKEDDEE